MNKAKNQTLARIRKHDKKMQKNQQIYVRNQKYQSNVEILKSYLEEWKLIDSDNASKLLPFMAHDLQFNFYRYLNNKLYYLETNESFESYKDFFAFLIQRYQHINPTYSLNLDFSNYVYKNIFTYIKNCLVYAPNPINSFEKHYLKYPPKTIPLFMKNSQNFIFIDNNVFTYKSNSLENCKFTYIFMDETFLTSLFPNTEIPLSFFQSFPTHLKKVISPNNFFKFRSIPYSPLSFHIKKNLDTYSVHLNTQEGVFEVIPTPLNYIQSENLFFTVSTIQKLKLPLTERLLNFIYDISSGSLESLDEISSIFCMLATDHYYSLSSSQRKMFVIHSEEDTLDFFQQLLDRCSFSSPSFNELKLLKKKENICRIYLYPFQHTRYILTHPSKREETPEQKAVLTRLIKGENIEFTNNISLPFCFRNQLPLLCFASRQKEISYLTKQYPTKVILLNLNPNKLFTQFNTLSDPEIQSLSLFLSLYGLFEQSPKNAVSKKTTKGSSLRTETEIIKKFTSDFCYTSPNSYLYFDELYSFYEKYCKHNHYGLPLPFISFNKIIKERFTYKRPHKTANDNRWAYENTAFDETTFNNYLYTPPIVSEETKLAFQQKILEQQRKICMALNECLIL